MKEPRHIAAFPATRISVIDSLRNGDEGERRRAFDSLTVGYWRPVRDYLSIRRHLSVEDAEDLAQSFFARALTSHVFERFDPQKARFRTYLRVCVDRFASNAARRDRAALTAANPKAEEVLDEQLAAAAAETAEDQILRDAWVRWFFERVIARLEQELSAAGKGTQFELFRAYDLGRLDNEMPPTYPALASRFSLPVTQVTNFLAFARREFRRLVLLELAHSSASDADYRSELSELLGGGQ